MKASLAAVAMAIVLASCSGREESRYVEIENDTFWETVDKQPLYSQGGGIFRMTDPRDGREKYFWYGVHYKEAEQYREDPRRKYDRCTFEGVSLYTADVVGEWHKESDVVTAEDLRRDGRVAGWLGRMGVGYVEEAKSYVLAIQENNSVLLMTGKSPLGPFERYRNIDMTSRIGTPNTGDQTVFVDKDGTPYLVYSYGRGRNKGYISRIGVDAASDSIDLVGCTKIFEGASREGNCMFRRGDKYYVFASNIYGWDGSLAYYLVSDSIYGPYEPVNDMRVMEGCEMDYAHVSQTGFFFNVEGSEEETVVFCGDRWADFANNGYGYNQWTPITFDKEGTPRFNSLSHWAIDSKTGLWMTGSRNNYVLNGSFEADRRIIPLAVKPRQEFLLGWETEIVEGTPVGVEVVNSPKLNCFNSEEDQRNVCGKMSMQISDTTHFKRRITQVVESRGDVVLGDGKYILRAKAKASEGFESLRMIAEGSSEGDSQRQEVAIAETGGKWVAIEMEVIVRGGRVTVGFEAEGAGGASCRIDDVSLRRKE
ncbi:MAG: family 43 glycosylhydrolase [Bacteroidales bacterium]|nr:family 43 glycosylhydrolase [Bacteroidales bacterium]